MVGWSFMFDRDDNWLMKRFYKSRVLDLSSQILDSGYPGRATANNADLYWLGQSQSCEASLNLNPSDLLALVFMIIGQAGHTFRMKHWNSRRHCKAANYSHRIAFRVNSGVNCVLLQFLLFYIHTPVSNGTWIFERQLTCRRDSPTRCR